MVGREAELRWLRDRIAPGPVAGPATAPRWVEIVGEAGVGKTRLVREAVGRCPELRLLVVGAVADTGRRPYGLLRRTMIELLLFATGDEAAFDDRGRFERALLAVDKSLAPYAAALWHVAAPTRAAAPAPDPDPVSLRRTIERGTSALLAALTAQHPGVVLLLDSLHHADPASLALLRALTGSAAAAAPLLIAAGRTSPHDDDAAATLTLLPLPPAAAGQMLDALTRGAALPEALRRSILERSGGVPLFVEELVQSLLESGALDCGPGRDGCVLTQEPAELRLPTSLHSALLSRLDAQPEEERELLTQLSVQGVEFDLDIAQRVRAESRWAGPPVAPLASSLERARMIARRKGAAAQARGLFRLALMQEAAYGTLVRRDRRALHELVAEALVELAGGAERVAPTALAWHEEMAERWERAAAARLRAGDQAAHLFLNDEAVGHYDRVLQLAEKAQAEVPARDRTQWTHLAAAAHGGAARIKLLTGDYPESLRRAERMREAAAREDDRAECLRIIAAIHARRGDAEEARRILEGVVHAAESADAGATKERVMGRVWLDLAVLHHRADRLDDAERCVAQARPGAERALQLEVDLVEGRILHTRGRFDAARAIYERAHHGATAQGSLSQRALAANRLGNAARDQGEYPTARRWYQQALADWSHIGDAEAVAGAWNNLGNVEMSIGERDAAAECFRRSLEASRRIGNVHGAALASANLAIRAAERRDGEAAVAAAGAALDSLGPAGDRLLRGLVAVVLGEGLHLCGRLDEADLVFRRVLHEFTAHDHPLAAAGAERGCGRVALARGATDEAIALLDRAHDRFTAIGRAQEAARTRLCLARALHASSRREQAMQHASAALHELEAMGAAQDAEQARLLLAALHAPV
jgi:tetratricopeptide (TPR) repeat protein